MTTVRVGQVWASKNTGQWVKLKEQDPDNYNDWMAVDDKGKSRWIPENFLVDDYVLVRDAP